jgi:hypothetical protein
VYHHTRHNIHSVSDVRQIEIHIAEPLVPDRGPFEAEIAVPKLKRCKSPGSDLIPAELLQAGGEILLSEIHKLINSIWNKEELPDQWAESIIVPIHKKDDDYRGILLLSTSYKILSNVLLSKLGPYVDAITGDHQYGFRRNRSFAFVRYWRRNGSTMRQYISYSLTSRKPVIQLGGKYCTIFS